MPWPLARASSRLRGVGASVFSPAIARLRRHSAAGGGVEDETEDGSRAVDEARHRNGQDADSDEHLQREAEDEHVDLRDRAGDEGDRKLSEQMMSYWTSFAKTGDPNGAGLPPWASMTSGSPASGEAIRVSQNVFDSCMARAETMAR